MATRRNEIFRDDHIPIRSELTPTADPAAMEPRTPAPPADADADPQPREASNAGLSGSRPQITDIARRDLIARAAYTRAEQRGFAPGGELGDWLAAERDIEWLLAGGDAPDGSAQ
jgi:hypothetical protein